MATKTEFQKTIFRSRSIWIQNWMYPSNPEPAWREYGVTWNNVRTGTSNPSYKDSIRAGQSATTDYEATFQQWKFSPGLTQESADVYGNSKQWQRRSDVTIAYPPDFAGVQSSKAAQVSSEAVAKLRQKVRSEVTKVGGPQALIELRKTAEMVRSPAEALRRAIFEYSKYMKNKRHRFHETGFLSGSYLEATFGWAPLLADIAGICSAVEALPMEPRKVFTVTAKADVPGLSYVNTQPVGYTGLATETRSSRVEYSTRIKGAINTSIYGPTDSAARLRELSGFTWSEFIPTIWEIVPYSFVIDYFTNINELLLAPYSSSGALTWTSTTQRIAEVSESKLRVVQIPDATYPTARLSGGDASASASRTAITRSGTLPPIGLSFELPGLRQGFNILALARQLDMRR